MLVVLVEDDVAARQSGLRQVIHQLLFLQRQFIETWHLVAQDLDIGETIDMDLEFRRCSGVIGGVCGINRRLFPTTGCKQQCR